MYNCVFCVVFLENELNLKYSDYHIYSKKKKTYWGFRYWIIPSSEQVNVGILKCQIM